MSTVPKRSTAERQRLTLWITAAIAAAGTVSYFLAGDSVRGDIWNMTNGLLLVGMAGNIVRFQSERARPWLTVWAGLALAYSGGLLMSYGSVVGFEPGSPSIVDAMRLSNYVLASAGALLVLTQHDRRTGTRATLETAMVTITGGMVIWFYVGLPMIEAEELSGIQTVVAAGYPLGNVLLLAVIASVTIRLIPRPGSLILLTLGLAGNLAADFLFSLQNLRGVYEPGGWIDLGWLICFAGLSMGPAWPDPLAGVARGEIWSLDKGHLSTGRLLMVGVALFAGPIILIDQTMVIDDSGDLLVVIGSAMVLLLAVSRLVIYNVDLARTESEVRTASEQLLAANTELAEAKTERQQLLWRIQRVVEEERTRIAADIHDRPIQELTVVGYQLERISLALARGDVDLAEEIVEGAADGLTNQLAELRLIMTEIRPPVLDERGLVGALEDSAARFMTEHSDVRVVVQSSVADLETETETVFYRVTQEALTNVARHAGPCDVTIRLENEDADIVLSIIDTGRGFDHLTVPGLVSNGRYGIAGMRERLSMLHGDMQIHATSGGGTTLRFLISRHDRADRGIKAPALPVAT